MDEMENRLARLPGALLPWYRENRRVLPWREEVSAYRTWVSEIMLQQTRVAAVIPYFQRFMAAYPTVEDLAACDEGELMRLWAGLGYYSRARNLRRAARVIAEEYGGAFPRTYQELMALPGVGDYTAGAILSIAFGEPVPAVDGNVLRVATETGSVLSIVQGMLPIIAVMVIILFVICTFLGRLLTDSLLRPIEQMAKNMDYDGDFTSGVVMTTTLLSSFTMTIWLYICKSLGLI